MRPLVAAASLVAFLLAGCGGEDAAAPAQTASELEITVWPKGRQGEVTTWTLRCDPPGGSHPSAERACAALAAAPELLERGPTGPCTQIFGGPQEAEIKGEFRGKPVQMSYNRADGCGIERWDRLKGVLSPPA